MNKLESFCKIVMGTSPKGSTYNEYGEGLPLLNGPTEFGSSHPTCTLFTTDSKKQCLPGDLIFCVRGSTTGRMNWADQIYSLGRGVCAIRATSEAQTRFVRYALEVNLQRLLGLAGGGTFPNLRKDDIAEFEIPLKSNWAKIVDLICNYDELIENNRCRIDLLEESVQQLYKEWFVRLNFPNRESTSIAIGLPEGWEITVMPKLIDINPKTLAKRDIDKTFVPMAGLTETLSIITKTEIRSKTSGTKFMNGDTLLARITPCIENGKTALVQLLGDGEVAIGSTEFIVLRPKQVGRAWTYCFARSRHLRQTAINSMKGSDGRQRVNPACFNDYPVLLPPQKLLDQFEKIAGQSLRLVHNLHQQNLRLAEARDLLLPRLMSGEIEV